MILTPHGFEPALALERNDEMIVHLFAGQALLGRVDSSAPLAWGTCRRLGLDLSRTRFFAIGRLNGVAHFAAAVADGADTCDLPSGWQVKSLRDWFGHMDEAALAVAMRGLQILEWDRTHRYCGACASVTEPVSHERARRCPGCNLMFYPRIAPAMMALIVRGRELLLGRGITFPPGRYSALAGFLEAGESVEDAIRREVMEEVGVQVDDFEYFGSQSWPFPHSLMIAFSARYAGGELRLDPAELADADWFDIDALPQLPPRLSIARALIEHTVARIRCAES